MRSIQTMISSFALALALPAVGAHGPLGHLPPSASYVYTTPALYLNVSPPPLCGRIVTETHHSSR